MNIDLKIIEKAAKAGFAAAAANAAREIGLDEPVTWDDLTDDDREHELIRTRAALSTAAPLIAAKALREAVEADATAIPDVLGYKVAAVFVESLLARADALEAGQS